MLYIGIEGIPVEAIASLGELAGLEAEYFNPAIPALSGYTRIEKFIFFEEQRQRGGRIRVLAKCGLLYPTLNDLTGADYKRWDSKGVFQNFRMGFIDGAEVVGHWFDQRRALKWTTGAAILPDGGEHVAIWMIAEPRHGIPGWRMVPAKEAAVETGLGATVALKNVPYAFLPRNIVL